MVAYYAFLADLDGDVFGSLHFRFDAIEIDYFDDFIRKDEREFALQAPHPGVAIYLEATEQSLREVVDFPVVEELASELAGDWFSVELATTGHSALVVSNSDLTATPLPTKIRRIRSLPDDVRAALRSRHTLSGGVEIGAGAPRVFAGSADDYWVACMDVGQAACCAVMGPAGRPVAYLDFGFPTLPNSKTAPTNPLQVRPSSRPLARQWRRDPQACLCEAPILLWSHWDWDHWYQAGFVHSPVPGTTGIQVVAPTALNVSTTALNFWSQLGPSQRLIFPMSGWVAFDWGFAVRCTGTGKDPNQNGVAFYVRVASVHSTLTGYPKGGASVNKPVVHAGEEYVLIPGDASFDKIPRLEDGRLVHLVATHHGDDHGRNGPSVPGLPPAPPMHAFANPSVAYSYGTRTVRGVVRYCYRATRPASPPSMGTARYGFPRPDAVQTYHNQGWTRRVDTATGVGPTGHLPRGLPPQHRGHIALSSPAAVGVARLTSCQSLGVCAGNTTMIRCYG